VAIEDEDIAKVRAAADIVQIVTGYTTLKRVGRRWQGLCPFHTEKSPSFSVNGEDGLYYCFGCQKSGDVITFVREKEQLDFVGAVEWLANKYGIALRYTERGEDESRKRRAKLIDAVRKAVEWYHARLLESADAGEARRYLRARGFDGETVRRYKIGWAPADEKRWDLLCRELRLSDDDLRASGLGAVNSRGRQYDFFRGRVLFPIFDDRGDPVGFGGRILPGHDGPKYKNTSDDAVIYSKSRILYGLNWAKEHIVQSNEAIVCEGYTDVIGFARAGVPRAVATCGTALTEDHIKLLKRFSSRIVLAFDADAAGQNAAARVYEWEQKLDVEFAVADLPDGVDPGELAQTDPDRLAASITNAKPFLGFRVERVLASGNLRTPEGRARTAQAAVDVVREHPSDLVRDQYLMTIADRCHLDPDQVRAAARAGGGAGAAATGGAGARDTARREPPRRDDGDPRGAMLSVDRPRRARPLTENAEDEALKLLVHRRDEIVDRLERVLFASSVRRRAFDALVEMGDLREAIATAEPDVANLLSRLAVEEPDGDPDQAIVDLSRYATGRVLDQLRREAAGVREPEDLRGYSEVIDWLRHRLAELDDQEERTSAAALLVAWLAESGEGQADD
jgi:DNA primase